MTKEREALEQTHSTNYWLHEVEMANIRGYTQGRVSGLKEALAQPEQTEQEPVACIYNGCLYMAWEFQSGKVPHDSCHLYTSSKLKEWMGLTFDEKYDLAHYESDPYEVVKNVEAKLREKNA
jgi:hypothetical protein